MTAIMHNSYGYTRSGFVRYLSNRALRLYPSYWFALIVSLAVIAIMGAERMQTFNRHMIVPPNLSEWVQNLTLIFADYYPMNHVVRLVPPTWALTVELFYYVLIGLGLSRTGRLTLFWVAVSAVYVIGAAALNRIRGGSLGLYGAIPAGSLPFAIGALTWHYRVELHRVLKMLNIDQPAFLIVLRWGAWAAIFATNKTTGFGWLITFGNYVNLGASALIVCALFHHKPTDRVRGIDKSIGDFSYPIYLLHWQCAAIGSMLLFGELVRGGTAEGVVVTGLGLAITVLFGLVCVRFIDPLIEGFRTKNRRAAR